MSTKKPSAQCVVSVAEGDANIDDFFDETSSLLQKKPNHNVKLILTTLWVNTFLSAMDGTIVANIMGPISASFEQEHLKQWIATSYLLANTAFTPLYGKLSDIIGRRNAMLIGQFFFGVGCFACAFVNSVPQFAFTRGISGIGGGGAAILTSIIMSDILTLEERGLYQGYMNLVYAFGQVIGAPLGSWALETVGWRWAFGVQGPLILGCVFLTYFNVDIKPKEEFTWKSLDRLDFGGAFTLVSFITSFLLIVSGEFDRNILTVIMVISFFAFIYIEKYVAKEQIVPLEMFKGELCGIFIVSFLAMFSMTSLYFGLPVFLQVVQKQTVQNSAKYLSVVSFPVSSGSLSAGYIISHYKGKNVTRFTTKLSLIYFTTLSIAYTIIEYVYAFPEPYSEQNNWKFLLVLGLVIYGVSIGSILVTTLITMVGIVGPENLAPATSLNFLFRAVGLVLGAGLSLSNFETYLSRNLYKLLSDQDHGNEVVKKLLRNASYLKTSKYIDDVLRAKILRVYQLAMTYSFSLAVASAYICATVTLATILSRTLPRNTTST